MSRYITIKVEDHTKESMSYDPVQNILYDATGTPWYGLNLKIEEGVDVKEDSSQTTLLKLAAILSDTNNGKAYLDKE